VTVSQCTGKNSTSAWFHVALLLAKPFACGSGRKQRLDVCIESSCGNLKTVSRSLELVSRLSQEDLEITLPNLEIVARLKTLSAN
jgi:hypothetical protein